MLTPFFRTDNPIADFEAYDAYLNEQNKKLPVCSRCRERIVGEYLWEIGNMILCEDCIYDARQDVSIHLVS